MKVVKIIISVSLLLNIISARDSFANDDQDNEPNFVAFSFSSMAYSRYLGAGTSDILYKRPVLQTDLFANFQNGLWLNVWHSTSLDNSDLSSDMGDELDIGFGFTNELPGGLSFDIGVHYFDCIDLLHMTKGDVIYPHAEIGRVIDINEQHSIKPFLHLSGLLSAYADEFGHTVYYRGGIGHEWKMTKSININQKAQLFYDKGGFCDYGSGLLAEYFLNSSYRLSGSVTIDFLSIKAAMPLSSLSDDREFEVVFGAGITITFY